MTDKLKEEVKAMLPCPFCGGEAYTYEADLPEAEIYTTSYHVGCKQECQVSRSAIFSSRAIELWNTRVHPEKSVQKSQDTVKCPICEDTVTIISMEKAMKAREVALLEGLKVAKEALEAIEEYCTGKDVFQPSLSYSTAKALKSISALLSTEAQQ